MKKENRISHNETAKKLHFHKQSNCGLFFEKKGARRSIIRYRYFGSYFYKIKQYSLYVSWSCLGLLYTKSFLKKTLNLIWLLSLMIKG